MDTPRRDDRPDPSTDRPSEPTTNDATSNRDHDERAYNSIPRTGRHRGDAEGLESGKSVRAPKPPHLEDDAER